jgi:hypothetical protein
VKHVLSPRDEITLVFFSEPISGTHNNLRAVERRGNDIEIQYQLEPYNEGHLTFDMALIPLGKMPVGEYRVKFRQLPIGKEFLQRGYKPINEKWDQTLLCKPFTFRVDENDE